METLRLYDTDAYLKEMTATVLDCIPQKSGFAVVLDRTCFFPEGGGQPGDTGVLGGVSVTDTREQNGLLVHMTKEPLEVGATVTGTIDWDKRFDLMQQHSGEHLVSGVVHRRWGYHNVGFHMGADMITIDFSGVLTEQQLMEVEQEVNQRIWQNVPLKCWYPEPDELEQLPYRSKKALTGPVRLVECPGMDLCACCGTHVAHTGEIGLVKILTVEKFHSGVRVEMLSGGRAYRYLTEIQMQNRQISQMLSAKVRETAPAVEALTRELEAKKQEIFALENEKFAEKALAFAGKGDVFLRMENLDANGVRRAAIAIQETCGGRAAVFSGSDESGYKYAVGHPGGDLRGWVRELNGALQGRGGGKPGFVQGSVQAKWEDIARFMGRKKI